MAVKAETDWWRLDFTLKEEKIFYRGDNNVYNAGLIWGRKCSINGTIGQKISLNSTEGAGEAK